MNVLLNTSFNPPAYPSDELNQSTGDICVQHQGNTLLDYFAGEAMKGYLSGHYGEQCGDAVKCADWSYEQAIEMLRARQKLLNAEEVSL